MEKERCPEEIELKAITDEILASNSPRKLVVGGPGTGKTFLFGKLLEAAPGISNQRIILTFINNLKDDLEKDLGHLAGVHTLHSYCLSLLRRDGRFRVGISQQFHCFPGLASLICDDWEYIEGSESPHFVSEMRDLIPDNHLGFYLARGEYYDAVDFDDSVYRILDGFRTGLAEAGNYELVLIDEYQDFNALEAGIIGYLGDKNRIVIAGDDDQALYCQLRSASSSYIRLLGSKGEYQVFRLPFCMRCPKAIVGAVNDVIERARSLGGLQGRIDKPYKHFPPAKGADSEKYPTITVARVSVQSRQNNYMGRYIAQEIARIPEDEVKKAAEAGYPAALVIVANPYREQIAEYLISCEFAVDTRGESPPRIDRNAGLSILKQDNGSNLGWRIVLQADKPPFMREAVVKTADSAEALANAILPEYRKKILAEAEEYTPPIGVDTDREEVAEESPRVKVTSFEGAKGLSAQHIFIAGLHNGEIPHHPRAIEDLEVCKFVVGLSRTRKKCTLLYAQNFAGNWKQPSTFISWIAKERLHFIKVDKGYWQT